MRRAPVLRASGLHAAEVLSDAGGRFLLRCQTASGGSALVLCLPLGEHASRNLARCRLAFDLGRGADCPAVPRPHEAGRSATFADLVVEDPGGHLLSALIPEGGLRLEHLFEATLAIAAALRHVHRKGILLRDLRPETVLMSADWTRAFFPTLDQASAQAGFGGFITGADGMPLDYVAPELTGRIEVPADRRADLYALGATFFHMASGGPPFARGSASETIYAHLAVPPPALETLRPELPSMFCRIVEKLLQKDPDERYESAYDLEADLTRCTEQFRKSGAIRPFTLTRGAPSPEFRLSEGFFGRRREIATLADAVERGAALGLRTTVTVSGPSGAGKSALVSQLQWSLAGTGAKFHTGKFDKFRQDQPYSAMTAVAQGMLRAVLRGSGEEIRRARAEIQEALGVQGKLLTDLIPELATFLGPQPDYDAVLPTEAALRFNEAVGRFLRVFATRETPLVVFLDDLQWADKASVSLLISLAGMTGLSHLMLILGYRSEEMSRVHPAYPAIEALAESSDRVIEIPVGELSLEDMSGFIGDTLRREDADTRALAAVIHQITEGNIFFAREYLQHLADTGALSFDDQSRAWIFDTETIRSTPPPSGTASFLARRLEKLPATALLLLDTASCIGTEFDLATLIEVHREAGPAIAAALAPAVEMSIILPLGEQHRLLAAMAGVEDGPDAGGHGVLDGAAYRFRHDQVRAVVHGRLDAVRRARLHLRIGNLMYEAAGPEGLSRRAVEIFRHYVWAADEMTAAEERERCASLGLLAGTQAIAGLAFDTARQYLEIADKAMGPKSWEANPAAKQQLQLALAECALALNDWAALEAISGEFLQHVSDPIAIGQMMGYRIRKMSTESRFNEATDLCVAICRRFGLRLPRHPGTAHVLSSVLGLLAAQGLGGISRFAGLKDTDDPQTRATVQLLNQSIATAYFAEPNLMPLIAITAARLSIRRGLSPSSPYSFAVSGFVLSGALAMYEQGYRYGEVAQQMARRYGESDQAHAMFVFNVFLRHLKEPWPQVVDHLAQGWRRSLASGDQEDATYNGGVLFQCHFLTGRPLAVDLTYPEVADYLRRVRMPHVGPGFDAWLELLRAMSSEAMPGELKGELFDYAAQIEEFKASGNSVLIAFSSVAAGAFEHLAGRSERAEERLALAKTHEGGMFAHVLLPAMEFFRARNLYRLAQASGTPRSRLLRKARGLARSLRKRAAHNPSSLRPLVLLLDAEQTFASGQVPAALLLLHQASELTAGEAPLYACLAQQRRAEILRAAGLGNEAADAARKAHGSALDWGSPALARMIAHDFDLPDAAGTPAPRGGGPVDDLKGFADLVGTLANENSRDGLLSRVLGTVLATASADSGVVALAEGGGEVRVRARADGPGTVTILDAPLESLGEASRRAIDAVLTTGQPQLITGLADAGTEGPPKSSLCVPIERNGRLMGAIHLENKVTRHAFTEARVRFAQAFASQAGIVLENTRLVAGIEEALRAQTIQAEANRRFVPQQFLLALSVSDIADVSLNQASLSEMSVVFADLRGFTAIAERLGPSATITMINRYLDHVQPGIAANGGFVVQYYGDGLLALFPGGADKALHGVAAMMHGLAAYNRSRGDLPELRSGIGVHHGPVTLGVIGDPDHMQCSVVGDAINVASRIQALTRDFNARILASGEAISRLKTPERFSLRPLGTVDIRGRGQNVELFEVLT
jgi:predicted ATPase/class 3 adenylate cyclase